MRILVTNDDGIASPGLHTLARAVLPFGDVQVVAPLTEHSGAGSAVGAIHLFDPHVHDAEIPGEPAPWDGVFAVEGPPALCVLLSRIGAFGPPPDLVVSGINPGANVGGAVYHSGTVGAAVTARNGGAHAVAVSQVWGDEQCWESAGAVAAAAVEGLLADPPSEPSVVSINVPNLPLGELAGVRSAPVGTFHEQRAVEVMLEEVRPGVRRVKVSFGRPAAPAPPESDVALVAAGFVTVTWLAPIHQTQPDRPGLDDALARLLG